MKEVLKWFGNILFCSLVLMVVVSTIMSISAKKKNQMPTFLGYKPMTVLTGSMAPKINAGDIIVDDSVGSNDIKVGDVVTYRASEGIFVTHRIIEITNQNGKNMYKTKGDANNTDDGKLITSEQIVGKVRFRIPYGGYVSRFTSSIYGFVLLILIPCLLLIWDQIKTILSEHKKEKAEKLGQG